MKGLFIFAGKMKKMNQTKKIKTIKDAHINKLHAIILDKNITNKMNKTIIIIFILSTNLLIGQSNSGSLELDGLIEQKDSLDDRLTETEKHLSDFESVYNRWKQNNKLDVFFYANMDCYASEGAKDFHVDTSKVINIKKGTKVVVVKATLDAYMFYYDGKEYFIQKENLTGQEEYNQTENKMYLGNLKDSLTRQISKVEKLEQNEKRLKTRKQYQSKKDSLENKLTEVNYELSNIDVGENYIVTEDCGIYLPYLEIYCRESDFIKNLPAGTKVKVTRFSDYISSTVIVDGKEYVIKAGCIMPESEYEINAIINDLKTTKDSLIQTMMEIETKLATIGYGEVFYFDGECNVYTGEFGKYNGGNYEMTIPSGTKVVVVGDGYDTKEIVFNGKRYWVRSWCLVPEKKYIFDLMKKQEILLKDSIAFANPTPYYFREDGWLCDSLDRANRFCIGDTIIVRKGTKVYFVKEIGNLYPRCIVYYNEKLFYTETSFLVSEKSINAQNKWRKEQEELTLEQNKQMQEYQKERLISLENKYGSKIAKDIINGFIWIGMTDEMAVESIGKPREVNRTVTQYLISEQWVYNSGVYLYFENGLLTAWQD